MKKARLFTPLLILIIVSLIVGLYISESRHNSDFTIVDALENSLIVLVGEYPDKPASITGRIFMLALLLFGILALGAIIGKISSIFVTRSLTGKGKMQKHKNHIVICNWNKRGEGIIRQLLKQTGQKPDIVVIHSSKIDDMDELFEKEKISFIQNDPAHHQILKKINAKQAKSVVILADEDSLNPDEKNALIALAIKHLEGESKVNVHIVAELTDPGRRRHLMEAGADEVVSNQDLNIGIIAQSALFRNMSEVYHRLLSYSEDTNEIYFIESGSYPAEYYGKSFAELQRLVLDSSGKKTDSPVILMGVKHQGEVLLNPRQSQFTHLQSGDGLIVMAYQYISEIPF